jgi:multiple sugar transport system ATP-binding protein
MTGIGSQAAPDRRPAAGLDGTLPPPTGEPHVRFTGVYKLFGNVPAVRNLDLEIAQGEFLVLVGPSGCGKTTTLRMLAGLERPTYGTIEIAGRVVNRVAPKDRNIALVFQNYALYPHMTVRENLAFGMRARREPAAHIRRRVDDVASTLDMAPLLERRPAELSGGQRQRVALGRALIREPEVFLMDEPLSNLDAALRVQMRTELAQLHERLGITTVYVTHDQVEAMTMGTRIALMRDGVLQQIDAPEALYVRPKNLFVASFIGSPRMNLVTSSVVTVAGDLCVQWLGMQMALPASLAAVTQKHGGSTVVIGVRPEDVRWTRESPTNSAPTFVGYVEVVEPLGSETLVAFSVNGESLVARFPPRSGIAPGDRVELTLDPVHCHLFDPDSGVNLTLSDDAS